jgi:hypothetical protein
MSREFMNPFDMPPYPNALRVGFGEENDVSHCEILSNGDVEFYDDPLGPPVLTLKPEHWETVKFIASHLEHYFVTGEVEKKFRKVADPKSWEQDDETLRPANEGEEERDDQRKPVEIVTVDGKPAPASLQEFALK